MPTRTCVACGTKTRKNALLRVVRTSEGVAKVDTSGRAEGRGAYVCKEGLHVGAKAMAVRIKRALRMESEVSDEFLEELAGVLTGRNEGTTSSQRESKER